MRLYDKDGIDGPWNRAMDRAIGQAVNEAPALQRGMVWCRTCRREQRVDSSDCLRGGWPKCCGYTMTIDHPSTWNRT